MFPYLRVLCIHCLVVAQVESLMNTSSDFSEPLLALSEPLFLLAPHLALGPPSGLHVCHYHRMVPLSLHAPSRVSPQGYGFLHNLSQISLHIDLGVSFSLLPKVSDDVRTLLLKSCSPARHSSCGVRVEPSPIARCFLMPVLLFTYCALRPRAIEVWEKARILHSIVFDDKTR